MTRRGGPTLLQGLDREVDQVVRKYLDDKDESPLKLKSTTIYEHIARSNSSLKRRPKKQLVDSIERVIDIVREDKTGDDEDEMVELEGDFDGEDMSSDWMNKQDR